MRLELSPDEARFLHEQLVRQLQWIEDELVHTDKRDLQREIAADAQRLRELIERMPVS